MKKYLFAGLLTASLLYPVTAQAFFLFPIDPTPIVGAIGSIITASPLGGALGSLFSGIIMGVGSSVGTHAGDYIWTKVKINGKDTKVQLKVWSPEWESYCKNKYKTFDGHTGFYQGNDGKQYFCH